MSIRLKYSITVILLVVLVGGALAGLLIVHERENLTMMGVNLCKVSAMELGNFAKDDLLLGNHLPIQDSIFYLMNADLEGLSYAYVVNREGRIVAHSNVERVESKLAKEDIEALSGLRKVAVANKVAPADPRKGSIIEISFPVIVKHRGREIFLGATRVGFSRDFIDRIILKETLFVAASTAVLLFVAVLVARFLAGRLTGPILELNEGVKMVGAGDLSKKIEPRTRDEIGALAENFNAMIDHLKEKLHMMKFMSASTVEMIRERKDEGLTLGGGYRDVTILFSDIRGFTSIAETVPPEDVVKILNSYLDLQVQIIAGHGGDIDKFVGDEVMALFDGDDQADRAVSCAIEIQETIKRINMEREEKGEPPITVGIGLNSGRVVVGSVGSRDRMDFTAIGDNVNLAARLCSYAAPQVIAMTRAVVEKCQKDFPLKSVPETIRVKGRAEAVEIFTIEV